MLAGKGLETVEDLLSYAPFRYEDRSNLKPIAQLAPGEMATVVAEVRSASVSGFKRRSLGMSRPTSRTFPAQARCASGFTAPTSPTCLQKA